MLMVDCRSVREATRYSSSSLLPIVHFYSAPVVRPSACRSGRPRASRPALLLRSWTIGRSELEE